MDNYDSSAYFNVQINISDIFSCFDSIGTGSSSFI